MGSPERADLETKSEQIAKLFLEELRSPEEIAQSLSIPISKVRDICSALQLRAQKAELIEEVKERVYTDKVPVLSRIVGASLEKIASIVERLDPAELGLDDAVKLSNISKGVNEMLRLEQGKSTQNVAVQSATQVRARVTQIFEVIKGDPVYNDEVSLDVPPLEDEPITAALPAPEESLVLEVPQAEPTLEEAGSDNPLEPF